jgi:hypothetical protein
VDLNKKATGTAGSAASSTTPVMARSCITVLDSDGDPYEYAVELPTIQTDDECVFIGISAAGGGTVGKSYANNSWLYAVKRDDLSIVISGSDIRSNATPATHAQMARTLCNFLSAAGESLYYGDDDSEYSDEYSDVQREFLAREYERLSMFGME